MMQCPNCGDPHCGPISYGPTQTVYLCNSEDIQPEINYPTNLTPLCDITSGDFVGWVYIVHTDTGVNPVYLDLNFNITAPFMNVQYCAGGQTPVDFEYFCDDSDPQNLFIGIWVDGTPPTFEYFTPQLDGTLVPYTPIGSIYTCDDIETTNTDTCWVVKNNISTAEYNSGDTLTQIKFWQNNILVGVLWYNETTQTQIGPVNIDDVTRCDDTCVYILTVEKCKLDVIDSDNYIKYTELYGIDCNSEVSFLGNFTCDLTEPYTPTGTTEDCNEKNLKQKTFILCDDNGSFLRHYFTSISTGTVYYNNETLEGTPYIPVGLVVDCNRTITVEKIEKCLPDGTEVFYVIRRDVTNNIIISTHVEDEEGNVLPFSYGDLINCNC